MLWQRNLKYLRLVNKLQFFNSHASLEVSGLKCGDNLSYLTGLWKPDHLVKTRSTTFCLILGMQQDVLVPLNLGYVPSVPKPGEMANEGEITYD